ncbi:MAG: PilZ domain-containing protein [Butyrivibrio sp.]|nr:PilZ domain-containing protein [Butyrivibrio sp.]
MEDKRKHKRLQLTGEIILKQLGGSGEATAAQIEIHDCSRDGIGFTTDAQLTIGNNYEANLTLWTKETLHVFVQIVRASKEGNDFHYGGIFIGMPDTDKMRIEVYETVEDQLKEQEKNK